MFFTRSKDIVSRFMQAKYIPNCSGFVKGDTQIKRLIKLYSFRIETVKITLFDKSTTKRDL